MSSLMDLTTSGILQEDIRILARSKFPALSRSMFNETTFREILLPSSGNVNDLKEICRSGRKQSFGLDSTF